MQDGHDKQDCERAAAKRWLKFQARRTFFNDIRALTRYLCFESWSHLLTFMVQQLELQPNPHMG